MIGIFQARPEFVAFSVSIRIHGIDEPHADLCAAGQFAYAALLDHQRQDPFAHAGLLRSTIRVASTVNFVGCAFSRLMMNPSLNPA